MAQLYSAAARASTTLAETTFKQLTIFSICESITSSILVILDVGIGTKEPYCETVTRIK